MLSSVKITNPRGNELELPMNEGAEIVIKGISGLGPVKADILTAEYVNVPGGAYKGNKQNQRNIVMLLGFQPTHESEDPYGELRRGLYPWFITGARVEMVFESTGNFPTVKIVGYVEDMLPTMFTQEPEVQVSIICTDPYFYGMDTISAQRVGNGTLTINNPGLTGPVEVGTTVVIDGFYSDSQDERFTLTRTSPSGSSTKYTGEGFAELSTIIISSIAGQKSAKYQNWYEYHGYEPSTGLKNVLGYVSGWLTLVDGVNVLNVDMKADPSLTDPPTVIVSFIPKYAGM